MVSWAISSIPDIREPVDILIVLIPNDAVIGKFKTEPILRNLPLPLAQSPISGEIALTLKEAEGVVNAAPFIANFNA